MKFNNAETVILLLAAALGAALVADHIRSRKERKLFRTVEGDLVDEAGNIVFEAVI